MKLKKLVAWGFKEIEKLNDALLAKQVWRMINNFVSLCHRVFKARFFLDCSILDAKQSKSRSYAWKSIIGARDVTRSKRCDTQRDGLVHWDRRGFTN